MVGRWGQKSVLMLRRDHQGQRATRPGARPVVREEVWGVTFEGGTKRWLSSEADKAMLKKAADETEKGSGAKLEISRRVQKQV